MKLSRFLGATALAGTLLSIPAVAWAQDATPAADTAPAQDTQEPADEVIVVTGTRLVTPNLVSTAPITSVTAAEIQSTASVSVGDALNDLPQLQSTFSQANSTRFLGTAGLNLLDLYGLGTQRTLVLLNGRRHVGSDILNNAVSPDVNTFPTDLIERVDIITGGESALYGSDAIAGVVNFILKEDYDGIMGRAQGSVSQWGDAGAYFASLTAGKNFAEGRGNVAVNLEYARQNAFYASDRDYLQHTDTFLTVDSDSAGVGGTTGNNTLNSDGNPDAVFFRDVRVGTFAANGLVALPGAAAGAASTARCGRDVFGRAYTCNYIFTADGNLIPQNGTRVGLAAGSAAQPSATPSGSFIGGNGDTRREGQLVQILPNLERYSANLIGHFTISDAFVPFVEAKYVRTNTYGQGGSGPAFFTGGTVDGFYERPRLDNPFLSTQARTLLSQQLTAVVNSGISPTTGASLTPAQQATLLSQINSGSYRFILRKNQTDLGIRSEDAVRETFRVVGGVKGDFNGDWHYELSANYGEFKERTKVLGNVNVQRELLAMDAVRAPDGRIVCGSQLDPTRAYDDFTGDAARLASDIAACVPYNPFGNGATDAMRNYILQDTVSVGKITQFDVTGYVAGDTSGFFNLWGGPISFALGGEYRRETNFFAEDPLVEQGYTFYNAIARFEPPSFEVKEAFAEVHVPIVKDTPFFHELSLSGSGRISDYKGSAGTVKTYSGGIIYAPVQDVTFRANYSRAVRAPNLTELYSPQSQNFAPGFTDPCSAINVAGGTQYRAANCAAAGAPAGYDYRYASSLEILSGGNPDLKVETSDSYTVGVLLQPRWLPGLSLSVDYYKIKVNDVITSVSAQTIANQCYDLPSLNNPFCALFQRAGAGGGPNGEEPFRIIEGSLLQSTLNFAKLQVRGINTTLAYNHNFGGVKLNARIDYTHQLENDSFTNPVTPEVGNNLLSEIGVPKDAANLNINADFGPIFTNWQFRYLSKMSVGAVENHQSYQGNPPQNLDDFDIPFYPEVFYIDARLGFNLVNDSTFYIGVDNLTNRIPPLGSTAIGGGSAIYDAVGRRFYAGVSVKF